MTPKEDKIFGAFLEWPLAPLEGVPTYEYMTNINVYLNLCLSAVAWTLGCGKLGYLVLTEQPAVFNTHFGTEFITPINPGIHLVMPDPAPTVTILSKLIRTHKQEVCLFNKYYVVNCACKKVINKLIPEKYYKSLSSRIIGLAKFTSLEILTCLINEYAELEEEDVQDINHKMKEPISGETLFEDFVEQILMESRSSSRAESVFSGSDCFYGVRKHRKMRAIPRQLPRMVSQDTKWQNMEQLQVSLLSSLQGYSKILNNFEDRRLCSARTRCTIQCGTFRQDAAGPHPGAGEYRDRHTIRKDISRAAHEDDIGAINTGCSPDCETRNSASRELLD